jgi:hypothetical protein
MKTNVEKVLERDQKLSELDDRAGNTNTVKNALNILQNKSFYTSLNIGLHYMKYVKGAVAHLRTLCYINNPFEHI